MTRANLVSRIGTALWRRRNPIWATPPAGQAAPHLELSGRTLPRYLLDRATLAVATRRHGTTHRPWITAESLALLDSWLRPTDHALEFGSGGSTPWLAARVGTLCSVEASESWYREVSDRVAGADVEHVRIEFVEVGPGADRGAYVDAHPHLEPGTLDLVLVDGEFRDSCARRAVGLLRPGGVLVLDNANTYLPGTSRAPWRVDEPATAQWAEFRDEVAEWRAVWTTNGVWDTALWFKP